MRLEITYEEVNDVAHPETCDDCGQEFKDEYLVRLNGTNTSLFMHLKCTKEFLDWGTKELNTAIEDAKEHYARKISYKWAQRLQGKLV